MNRRPTKFVANLKTRTIVIQIDDYSKICIELPKNCKADQCKISYCKDCKRNILKPVLFDIEDYLVKKE